MSSAKIYPSIICFTFWTGRHYSIPIPFINMFITIFPLPNHRIYSHLWHPGGVGRFSAKRKDRRDAEMLPSRVFLRPSVSPVRKYSTASVANRVIQKAIKKENPGYSGQRHWTTKGQTKPECASKLTPLALWIRETSKPKKRRRLRTVAASIEADTKPRILIERPTTECP